MYTSTVGKKINCLIKQMFPKWHMVIIMLTEIKQGEGDWQADTPKHSAFWSLEVKNFRIRRTNNKERREGGRGHSVVQS